MLHDRVSLGAVCLSIHLDYKLLSAGSELIIGVIGPGCRTGLFCLYLSVESRGMATGFPGWMAGFCTQSPKQGPGSLELYC